MLNVRACPLRGEPLEGQRNPPTAMGARHGAHNGSSKAGGGCQ